MRICVITPYFYPHAGGSQEYILQLYTALRTLDPSIAVDVISYNTDGAATTEQYRGLTIYRVGCIQLLPGQFALPNYIELIQLLQKLQKEQQYDLINAHTRFFDSAWWTPLVGAFFGTPTLLTDHCADHPKYGSVVVERLIALVDRLVLALIPRLYTHRTVVSQATQRLLKQHGSSSTVFVSGVDPVFTTHPAKSAQIWQQLAQRHRIPPHNRVVTFIGRMIPSKNPQVVVEVARAVASQFNDVSFVFAGSGPALAQLKRNAPANCRFLGQVDRDTAAALLTQSEVFVYPSVHHEGIPIGILEAGARGCAVIASNAGGIPEVISSGKTGILTAPTATAVAPAVVRLLTAPKEAQKLGVALQKKVQTAYNWQQTALKYQEFLSKILSDSFKK